MAILVTGGTGYIGSHTCVELLENGEDVVIIDNFSNSKQEVVEKIEELSHRPVKLYEGDIRDYDILDRIFIENKIEAVIHFAGLKAVGESVEKPLEYYDNNISGTLALLEVMKKYDCKRIVFSSSATVYGTSTDVPFKETHPTSATNPYGRTKLMLEEILTDLYVSDNSWSVTLLRYFNPIGAHKSGLLGEDPNGIPNNLVPYIAKVAMDELPVVQVLGGDYDTPDGTGVRDYLHVVDLALGHVKALNYMRPRTGVDIINLGTGNGYSVLDVIKSFEKACGKKLEYEMKPRRAGDIATCYADASKAKELLDWSAQRELDEMCVDSWNFIQQSRK